ncbi:MAG: ribonuclease HII [Bdellovibrionota bacterium]
MGPDASFEKRYLAHGHRYIAGVDEVGRGCLAGPVVAAAVILDMERIPDGLNDSKKLSPAKRKQLDTLVRDSAVSFAIGVGHVEEIDTINILNASKLAMVRAVQTLQPGPTLLLLDGNFRIDLEMPQVPIVKGDQKSVSIAAASILAKVYRDALMIQMDTDYPGYDFASHKGYGSKAHRVFLQSIGPSPIHRKSFQWTPV